MKLDLKSYKGTRDIYPEDMRLRNYIFAIWRQVCESFGYEEYDAPILEPLELYAAKTGEEIVNEQTYTFTDRGDRRVSIRPEMTPSVARMVAARRQELPLPLRLFSISNFMRYERPQRGREREFWQLNVDLFGAAGLDADIETITIADRLLRKFGATDEMFTILVNDRRLTDYIMREYLGLDEVGANAMIKLFDRRAKISEDDFVEQAKEILGDAVNDIDKVTGLINVKSLDDLPEEIKQGGPTGDLRQLLTTLTARGISNVRYDVTLMRGFDYYTGIVFEAFDNSPANNRSMFGGGRYDGLVGLFGVEDMPVVGFAPGETTLAEFLAAWDLVPDLKLSTDIFIVPIGGAPTSAIADQLRDAGVNVAVDSIDRKLDKSIRAAVKMGVPYIMFIGDEELKSSKFKIKNLASQEEKTASIDEIAKMM